MTENMTTIETETGVTDLVAEDTILPLSTFEEFMQRCRKIDTIQALVSITPRYKEFTPGESVRGVYVGLKFLNKGSGERIRAVQWIDGNGNAWLNAGTVLVQTLETLPIGAAIEITLIGKKPTANGYKVNEFEIRLLQEENNHVPF